MVGGWNEVQVPFMLEENEGCDNRGKKPQGSHWQDVRYDKRRARWKRSD